MRLVTDLVVSKRVLVQQNVDSSAVTREFELVDRMRKS